MQKTPAARDTGASLPVGTPNANQAFSQLKEISGTAGVYKDSPPLPSIDDVLRKGAYHIN
jgi:hypothetical protein